MDSCLRRNDGCIGERGPDTPNPRATTRVCPYAGRERGSG